MGLDPKGVVIKAVKMYFYLKVKKLRVGLGGKLKAHLNSRIVGG